MTYVAISGWVVALIFLAIILGICWPDRDEKPPHPDQPTPPPVPVRSALRHRWHPSHADAPLPADQLARLDARWQDFLASYERKSPEDH